MKLLIRPFNIVGGYKEVSKAQEAAMLSGATKGRDCPLAKPKNYEENGKAIKMRGKERQGAKKCQENMT